jgi:hypothetical protein
MSDRSVELFVRFRVAEGYHIYAMDRRAGENIPTTIELDADAFLTPDGPWQMLPATSSSTATLHGEFYFCRRFLVHQTGPPQQRTTEIKIGYQACNDAVCWPPETIRLAASWIALK